jgi:hypothetical protein
MGGPCYWDFHKKGWLDMTTAKAIATVRAAQLCKEME